jgi:hypothetical protein
MPNESFSSSKQRTVALTVVFAVSIVLAYLNRFIQDDAFISFRYALNLTLGEGLVWNPGDYVEGYSNFLWTLLMSAAIRIGLDPVPASQAFGLFSFVGTLAISHRLALHVCRSGLAAILVVLVLGTNFTFSSYATGGLETQFQTFLIVSAVYLSLKACADDKWSSLRLAALSLLYAAALLTRLDSAAALLPAFVWVSWCLIRSASVARPMSKLAAWLLPAIIVVGAWLNWKFLYYGDLLPNSFYSKATASVTSASRGLIYIGFFFWSYVLFPFVLIAPFRIKKIPFPPKMRILAVILVTWSIYVISVGGDFMEFRFLVPVMPLGTMFLVTLVMSFRRQAVRIALIALVIAGSIWHATTFRASHGIASIDNLKRHLVNPNEDWIGIGKTLHRLFYVDSDEVSIATTAAGAIPYYSGLRTIDQMGINDKFVAKHGVLWATRPGHQRLAPHGYLRGVGVNLVIGHPRVSPIGRPFRQITTVDALEKAFHVLKVEPDKIPPGAGFIDIPVNQWYKVTVFYLTPSKTVDRVIRENNLRVYPLALGP